jgi:hypothetical protein
MRILRSAVKMTAVAMLLSGAILSAGLFKTDTARAEKPPLRGLVLGYENGQVVWCCQVSNVSCSGVGPCQ